jgi:hypothetical protein
VKADRAQKDNPHASPAFTIIRKELAPASQYCAAETNFSGKLRRADDKRNFLG